jgi:hypothetical protein
MAATSTPPRFATRRLPLLAAFALAAFPGPRPGIADDQPLAPPAKFSELVTQYTTAQGAGDLKAQARVLGELCETAAKAVADPKDPAALEAVAEDKKTARMFCRKALTSRDKDLLIAALAGYGKLALPGSSAELKQFADSQLSEKRPLPVRLAAVSAWAAIHDPGSHPILLDYIKLPSRDENKQALAVSAARGLAEFRGLAKGSARFEFLRDYMQIFDGIYNSGILLASADSATWWGLLHPVMVESFNLITRASVSNHAAAVEWWRANRRKVQAGTD